MIQEEAKEQNASQEEAVKIKENDTQQADEVEKYEEEKD